MRRGSEGCRGRPAPAASQGGPRPEGGRSRGSGPSSGGVQSFRRMSTAVVPRQPWRVGGGTSRPDPVATQPPAREGRNGRHLHTPCAAGLTPHPRGVKDAEIPAAPSGTGSTTAERTESTLVRRGTHSSGACRSGVNPALRNAGRGTSSLRTRQLTPQALDVPLPGPPDPEGASPRKGGRQDSRQTPSPASPSGGPAPTAIRWSGRFAPSSPEEEVVT